MIVHKQNISCDHQVQSFLHCLQQKQTFLAFPELLAMCWNKPSRNYTFFPVTSQRLLSETPLW